MVKKIAFCFLLYDTVLHREIWEKFFQQDCGKQKTHSIYSHIKTVTKDTPQWLKKSRVRSIKTGWCEENLVSAWIKMIREALKDPDNAYFVILSGECIPLFDYKKLYKKATASKKSRINIDYAVKSYAVTGLYYADQWVLLNRKCAKLLVDMKDTKRGKEWLKATRKRLCYYDDDDDDDFCSCPDEILPVNWFVHNFGKPTTKGFKSQIREMPTTYTYWDPMARKPHPEKFTLEKVKKFEKDICSSGALFARKFEPSAGTFMAMNCNKNTSAYKKMLKKMRKHIFF